MSKPTNNPNQPSAAVENNRYFNEYANGIGYLNSIRAFSAEGKPSLDPLDRDFNRPRSARRCRYGPSMRPSIPLITSVR